MSRLSDHRRFAAATAITVALGCAVLGILLAVLGRATAISGLVAGTVVALIDVALMVRAIDRLNRRGIAGLGARTVRSTLFSRFLIVAVLIGVVICARGLQPVGVVIGFMLLPLAIVLVGVVSLYREAHTAPGRFDGAAR